MVNLGNPPREAVGHEQAFNRPCLVVQSLPTLKLAVIVPLTTKGGTSKLFSVVPVKKGTAGLNEDSFILCHQIRTVSNDRIIRHIGKMPNLDFNKVLTVLADFLEV